MDEAKLIIIGSIMIGFTGFLFFLNERGGESGPIKLGEIIIRESQDKSHGATPGPIENCYCGYCQGKRYL